MIPEHGSNSITVPFLEIIGQETLAAFKSENNLYQAFGLPEP
jgi:hypothetical protein